MLDHRILTKEMHPLFLQFVMLTTVFYDGFCLNHTKITLCIYFKLGSFQWTGDLGYHSDGELLSNSDFGQALESDSLSIPRYKPNS